MKCKIISITISPLIGRQAIQFYSKQLPNHFQVSYAEVKPFSSKSRNENLLPEAEGDEILKMLIWKLMYFWDRQGKG